MSAQKCTLCGLETPSPPVTDSNTEGVFCCTGCLNVHQLLDELDDEQAERLRRQTINLRKNENQDVPLPDSHQEAFFNVNGMHCATCESFIESVATQQDGIYKAQASYASEMLKVYYDAERINLQELPAELSEMGYRVSDIDESDKQHNLDEVGRTGDGRLPGHHRIAAV
ncbi:MAG: heavy metal-associated domain-containing protein [Fodinibius sp.]|nr:heavy metal-associated domain-containing protein [Fodinibius sp.]